MKTNAAASSTLAPYELRAYEVDPDDLSAISVARKIDLPPEQVFKTCSPTPHEHSSPSSPTPNST